MLKILLRLSVILALFFGNSNVNHAQTLSINSQVYDSLKLAGALTPGLNYLPNDTILPAAGVSQPGQWGGGIIPLAYPGFIPSDNTYTSAMPACDDCSSGAINLPFTFCFYGQNYSTIYINNNGNISMNGPYGTFSSVGFPVNSYPMLAPFWADVDTRSGGTVKYKVTPTACYITWEGVGYYSMQTDKICSFSMVITDGTDPILTGNRNVGFGYADMTWTTGAASCWGGNPSPCTYNGNQYTCGGNGGFCGTPSTVGANKGDGIDFSQIGRFDHPGTDFNGNTGISGVDWLDNQAFEFNICNIPPVLVSGSVTGGNGNGGGVGIPMSGTLCQAGMLTYSYTFDAPEQNQTTTITVDGSACPGYSLVSNTQNGTQATVVFTVTPIGGVSGSFPIILTATDDYNPPASTSITVIANIIQPPISVPITGPTHFCAGTTFTLSAPPGYNSYAWTPNGEITQIINSGVAGTFQVTVDSLGCFSASAPFTVVEDPNPIPVIIGLPVYCAGSTTTLTATPVGMITYAWSDGQNTNPIQVNTVGPISVTVTDVNGCIGTSATMNIILGNPQVTITGIQIFCQNDSITLTAQGSNFSNFLWNDGTTDSTISAIGGTYSVTVTDIYGCQDSDTVTVTPEPLPNAAFSGTSVCLTNSNQFTDASTVPTNDIIQWVYSFGDGNTTSSQNTNHIYNAYGTFGVTLTVTTANGCVDNITQLVDVYPNPVGQFWGVNNTGCVPIYTNFTDQSTIATGSIVQWNWNLGNGIYSTQQNISSAYTSVDSFTVSLIVISNHGCTDTSNMVDFVKTFPNPVSSFTYNPTTIDMNDPVVVFTDGSINATYWSWNFGDGNLSNNQNPTNIYSDPGIYTVILTISNDYGCQSQSISELTVDNGFQIFVPSSFSPDDDGINDTFEVKGSYILKYELLIFDRWGSVIKGGANINWDGKIAGTTAKQDIYVFKLKAYDSFGLEHNLEGFVFLVR